MAREINPEQLAGETRCNLLRLESQLEAALRVVRLAGTRLGSTSVLAELVRPWTALRPQRSKKDPRRENRAYESTPPHSGQKPRPPERQPGSRAPKRPRKDAGQHVSAHKRRPTERGGVLRTATTRSTRPPADAAQGQNVNIRRATAASRGEGGAANSHRQTVKPAPFWFRSQARPTRSA